MLRVMRNHRRAAYGERSGYEEVATPPVPIDAAACPDPRLVTHARAAWDKALELGEAHGYRNAQASVIAPTGTIGLVMDCDTTGIEPDFALVKFKKLAGGGYFKIINRAVPEALRALGYRESEIAEIEAYAVGHGTHVERAGGQPREPAGERLRRGDARQGGEGPADGLRHQVRVQPLDARRRAAEEARRPATSSSPT